MRNELKFGNQITKASSGMWLGKDVGKLILRGNRDQLEGTLKKVMLDKMTIDLDVFGPLVEDIIASNLNSTTIVTIDRSGRRSGHT
jgi:hypothetical protein